MAKNLLLVMFAAAACACALYCALRPPTVTARSQRRQPGASGSTSSGLGAGHSSGTDERALGEAANPEPALLLGGASETNGKHRKNVPVRGALVLPLSYRVAEVAISLRGPLACEGSLGGRCGPVAREARTNTETFELGTVPEGSLWELHLWGKIWSGEKVQRTTPRCFTFKADGSEQHIELGVPATATGIVVNREGERLTGVHIQAVERRCLVWGDGLVDFLPATFSNDAGEFELGGLPESGAYLIANADGLLQTGRPRPAKPGSQVTLTMAPPRVTAGQVVGMRNCNMLLNTIPAGSSERRDSVLPAWYFFPGWPLRADGRFSLPLTPGTHVIYAWCPDTDGSCPLQSFYACAEARGGEAGVKIALLPGLPLEGAVEIQDGGGMASDVRIEGQWGLRCVRTNDLGQFRVSAIPPGRVTLEARSVDGTLVTDLTECEAGDCRVHMLLREPRDGAE